MPGMIVAPARTTIVGVISDTHGLLRPQALDALHGCDAIVHAGDIGHPDILAALARLAPVTVVRGNVDRQDWARSIPETAVLAIDGAAPLFVLHDIARLAVNPVAAGYRAVIFGHSHKPGMEWRNGVLFLNPGSAGPRRFSLPISLARVRIGPEGPEAELLTLDPG